MRGILLIANRQTSPRHQFATCNLQLLICNLFRPGERLAPQTTVARPARFRRTRSGLTLYEVILSLAILLPSLVVLGQMISQGTRAAVQSRLQTQAVLRCETVLSEVLAGIWPMQPAEGVAFEDAAPGWTWNLLVTAGPHPDLLALQVTVEHADTLGTVNASYSLTRLVRDPQLYIDAAAMAATEAAL